MDNNTKDTSKYIIRSSNYNDKSIVLFVEEYQNRELIKTADVNIKFRQPEYFNFIKYNSGINDEDDITIEVELTKEGKNVLYLIGYTIGYPSKFTFNKNLLLEYIMSLTTEYLGNMSGHLEKVILVFDPLAMGMKSYFVKHKVQYKNEDK